ncbi:MAG: YfbM family protein [Defluviitaleaceae bacterium]|nr:YfbM family protein [Defluviitaleaceae bacterium]
MGMVGIYLRTSDENITKLHNGTLSIADLVLDDDGEYIEDETLMDIDKAWHMLHFVLTGQTSVDSSDDNPLSKVAMGGDNIRKGEDCDGWQFGRSITSQQVVATCEVLKGVKKSWIADNFNLSDMLENEVYPVQDHHNKEEMLEYLLEYFDDVVDFFNEAKDENQAIVFFVA